ncbi:hypothetical protein WJM97_22915 (plasmid) [Okeanomitos corallinicola TIOX110]|uniref:Uncharacterized protein n=1 Tax=Okeanomitos corallinicola TIOX110 TaxID=3133117 RepID=A0ABZ2UZY0_9CYAN
MSISQIACTCLMYKLINNNLEDVCTNSDSFSVVQDGELNLLTS